MNITPFQFDERRLLALPGDHDATLNYAVNSWIKTAVRSIHDHGFFAVALSGGSTPKKIFEKLAQMPDVIDWSLVYLFFGDERSVPPSDSQSNYKMAIEDSGLGKLPIRQENIFRMVAEKDIESNAAAYEAKIREKLGNRPFDLIMLGMGDDGHTASLFPHTKALHATKKLVVANHVPQKNTLRMTLTFECINQAHHICIYVLGASKAPVLENVLTSNFDFEKFPSQNIGTKTNPALWVLDLEASKNLLAHLK